MSLINCEINLTLTWTERCFIIDPPIVGQKFTVTDRKLYVPFLTLSTQDNAKLLKQIKWSLKKTVNWNKYEPKVTVQQQNWYLDLLINTRPFALSFENNGLEQIIFHY